MRSIHLTNAAKIVCLPVLPHCKFDASSPCCRVFDLRMTLNIRTVHETLPAVEHKNSPRSALHYSLFMIHKTSFLPMIPFCGKIVNLEASPPPQFNIICITIILFLRKRFEIVHFFLNFSTLKCWKECRIMSSNVRRAN